MPNPPTDKLLRTTDADAIATAKSLIEEARFGALAVLDPQTGTPLVSRVAVGCDYDGAPIILISTLSMHTRAIMADPRCSLLLGEPGKGDPLAHPRITLVCRAVQVNRTDGNFERVRARFLAQNPKATLYADFADFAFFKLDAEQASLIVGFGKAYALTRADLLN
jgi:putative heme iron utilization protein